MFYIVRRGLQGGWGSWKSFRKLHPALYSLVILLIFIPFTILSFAGAYYCLHFYTTVPHCTQEGTC